MRVEVLPRHSLCGGPAHTQPQLGCTHGGSPLSSEEGTTQNVLKTFTCKMAQGKARLWPRLSHVFQVRSTAVGIKPEKMDEDSEKDLLMPLPSEKGTN